MMFEAEQPVAATEYDTRTLLVRTGMGDRAAFGRLYDQTATQLFLIIRSAVHDCDRALADTERAFLEIWRRSPAFHDSRDGAARWILDITKRITDDSARE